MKAGSSFIGALKLLKIPKKSRLSILKIATRFYTCVVLFLILTLLFLSAQKLSTFIIAEILIYSGIQWLFRQQTYHFTVKKKRNPLLPILKYRTLNKSLACDIFNYFSLIRPHM